MHTLPDNTPFPLPFIEKMQALLGDEAPAFFASLHHGTPRKGLRANTLKIAPDALPGLLDMPLLPVPWCKTGFMYAHDKNHRPGKHPLYQAGLFYLQEPSAMSSAAVLDAQPGERVLDLCAAPGGKAAQIAGALQGRGLLVANDASASRNKALVKNLCATGVRNAAILCETPARLAARFADYFHKIVVDAPCSGEGMFRKDPETAKHWVANKPAQCVVLQREILHHAAQMLAPGGRLVYSTCTFDPSENEGLIAEFLAAHTAFEVEPIPHEMWGFSPARPEWANAPEAVHGAARIWPHLSQGEGHFLCALRKKGEGVGFAPPHPPARQKIPASFVAFCEGALRNPRVLTDTNLHLHGDRVFSLPSAVPDLSGLRVARSGWLLGQVKKDRFEPSRALALGLTAADAAHTYTLSPDACGRYLAGETLDADTENFPPKAWVLMCYEGFPLGWARFVNGRLKNKALQS